MSLKLKKKFWLAGGTTSLYKAGSAVPSYVFAGSVSSAATGANVSGAINIGTAAANRLIIIAGSTAAAATPTSVTINGFTCTLDVSASKLVIASIAGTTPGSGSQTVAVNWSAGSFNARGFSVWVCSNMVSSTVVQSGTGSGNPGTIAISVTAGDLMFGVDIVTGAVNPTWSTSTQAPANTQIVVATGIGTADWTIASTNASFSAIPGSAANNTADAVATYH